MRTTHALSFLAVFIEDGVARLWNVEMASGATDEIARFSTEGMTRPQILEISRQFARARRPATSVGAVIENADAGAPVKKGPGRPRKVAAATPVKRTRPPRDHGSHDRGGQIARQAELYEALTRHGDEGIPGPNLAAELGRKSTGIGVSLGILQRQGKAIHVGDKWYAIDNGSGPPPSE